MTNHPNRSRLGQAIDTASAIIASGSVTLMDDPAHDAGVLARYEAALLVIDRAIIAYSGSLASPLYKRADEQRTTFRLVIEGIRSRMAA